jgi:hypothetical protein
MLVFSIVTTLLLILEIFGSISSPAANHTYATQIILAAEDDFRIQNTSSFIDESSIMHIYGEIVNTSNRSLSNVTAKGSFYDNSGKLLNEYRRDCELPTVNPDGICPFEILYIDTKTVKAVKDFKLSAVGTLDSKGKPNALKVFSEGSKLDMTGFYYINGRILNEGSEISTLTTIVATLYDKDGKVIALGRALAEPVSISPDIRASFGIAVTEKKQTYKTNSYSLVAYSNQYLSPSITVISK